MNDIIADRLALSLIDLEFLTATCGCVRTNPVRGKRLPVTTKAHFQSEDNCIIEDGHIPMIPSHKQMGIAFFEDLGENIERLGSRLNKLSGSLKLVVWVNMDKINPVEPISSLQTRIFDILGAFEIGNGSSRGGKVKVSRIYPKWPTAFSRYDLPEEKTQFLTAPYDHFALRVDYFTIVPSGCSAPIVIQPAVC